MRMALAMTPALAPEWPKLRGKLPAQYSSGLCAGPLRTGQVLRPGSLRRSDFLRACQGSEDERPDRSCIPFYDLALKATQHPFCYTLSGSGRVG